MADKISSFLVDILSTIGGLFLTMAGGVFLVLFGVLRIVGDVVFSREVVLREKFLL